MIRVKINKAQAAEWAKKTKGKVKEWAIETLQDLNQEVVYNTPVVTGFLRGSWWATIGEAGSSGGSADPSGGQAIARLNLTALSLELGDTYTVYNGAAYAARVEFGFVGEDSLGRHYDQAPRAMVGKAVARFQQIAEAAAMRVRRSE